MNRKILFKAKRKDNGEWVEGSLISTENNSGFILQSRTKAFVPKGTNTFCSSNCYEIDPDTICQFTGLTDKNDKKIWENDIVKCNKRTEGFALYKVVWRKDFADFGVEPMKPKFEAKYPMGLSDGVTLHGCDYKVIGNIFDNAELLEVE